MSESATPDIAETSSSYSYSYSESVKEEVHHGHAFRVVLSRLEADGVGSDFHHEVSGPVSEKANVRCAFYLSTHHTPSPTSSSLSSPTSEDLETDPETATPIVATVTSTTTATATAARASPTTEAAEARTSPAKPAAGAAAVQRLGSDLSSNTDDELTEETYRTHYPWRVESSAKVGDARSGAAAYAVSDVDIQVSETEDATLIATVQLGVALEWAFTLTSPTDGAASTNVWLVCEIIDEVMPGCALKCAIALPAHPPTTQKSTATTTTAVSATPPVPPLDEATTGTRRALFEGNPDTDVTDADEVSVAAKDAALAGRVEKIPFVMMHDTGARTRRSTWFLTCRVEPIASPARRSQISVTHAKPAPAPQVEKSLHATAASAPPTPPPEVPSPSHAATTSPPLPSLPALQPTHEEEAAAEEAAEAAEASLHTTADVDKTAASGGALHDKAEEEEEDRESSIVSSTSTGASPSLRATITGAGASEVDPRSPVRSPVRTATVPISLAEARHGRPLSHDTTDSRDAAPDDREHTADEESRRTPEHAFVEDEDDDKVDRATGADANADVDDAVEEEKETDAQHKALLQHADGTSTLHDVAEDSTWAVTNHEQRLKEDSEVDDGSVQTWSVTGSSAVAPHGPTTLADGVSPLPRRPRHDSASSSSASSVSSASPRATPTLEAGARTTVPALTRVPSTAPASASPPTASTAPKSVMPAPATVYLSDEVIRIPALVTVDGAGPSPELLLPRLTPSVPDAHNNNNNNNNINSNKLAAQSHDQTTPATLAESQRDLFERSPSSTTSSVLSSTTSTRSHSRTDGHTDTDSRNHTHRGQRHSDGREANAEGEEGEVEGRWKRTASRSQPFASSPLSSSRVPNHSNTVREDDGEAADRASDEAQSSRHHSDQPRSRRHSSQTMPSTDTKPDALDNSASAPHATAGPADQARRPRPSRHRQTIDEVLASHRTDDIVPYEATQPRPPPPPPMALSSEELVAATARPAGTRSTAKPRPSTSSAALLSSTEFRENRRGSDAHPPSDTSKPSSTTPAPAATATPEKKPAAETGGGTTADGAAKPTPTVSVVVAARHSDSMAASPASEDPLGQSSARLRTSTDARGIVDVLGSATPPRPGSGSNKDSDEGTGAAAGAEDNRSLVSPTSHLPLAAQHSFTSANQFTSSAPVSPKSVASNRRQTNADEDYLTYNTDKIGQGMQLMHFARLAAEVAPVRRSFEVEGGSPRPPRSPRRPRSADGDVPALAGVQPASPVNSANSASPSSSYAYSYSYSEEDEDYSYSYSASSREGSAGAGAGAGAAAHRESGHADADAEDRVSRTSGTGGDGDDGHGQHPPLGGDKTPTPAKHGGPTGASSRRSRRHSRRRARSSGGHTALPLSTSQVGSPPPPHVSVSRPPTPLPIRHSASGSQGSSGSGGGGGAVVPIAHPPPSALSAASEDHDADTKKDMKKKKEKMEKKEKKDKGGKKGILCCGGQQAAQPPAHLEALYQCITERVESTRAPPRSHSAGLTADGEADDNSAAARVVPALHAEHICLVRLPAATPTATDDPTTTSAGPEASTQDAASSTRPHPSLSYADSTTLEGSLAEAAAAAAAALTNGNTARALAENMQRLITKLRQADGSTGPLLTSEDSTLMRSALDELPRRASVPTSSIAAAAEGASVLGADVPADAPEAASHTADKTDEAAAAGSLPHNASTASPDQRAFVPVSNHPSTTEDDDGTPAVAADTHDDGEAKADHDGGPVRLPPLHLPGSTSHEGGTALPPADGMTLPVLPARASTMMGGAEETPPGRQEEGDEAYDEAEMELAVRSKTVGPSMASMPYHAVVRPTADGAFSPTDAASPNRADEGTVRPVEASLSEDADADVVLLPLVAYAEMAPLPHLYASDFMPSLPYLRAFDFMAALPYLYASDFMAALPYLAAWDAQPPWQKPAPHAALRAVVPPSTGRFFFFVRLAGLARVACALSRPAHADCAGDKTWEETSLRVSLCARQRGPVTSLASASWRVASGSLVTVPSSPAALRGVLRATQQLRDDWSDVLIFSDAAVCEGATEMDKATDDHDEPRRVSERVEVFLQLERCVVRHITRTCQTVSRPPTLNAVGQATPAAEASAELGVAPATASADATSPVPLHEEASQATLAISLSDRTAPTAETSIVFQSEHSVLPLASVRPSSASSVDQPSHALEVVVSSSTTTRSDSVLSDSSMPPPPLADTQIRARRGGDGDNAAVPTPEEKTPEEEADTEEKADVEPKEAVDAQTVDWSYHEVTWEPLAISPAVCLRALQEAAAAFTLHTDDDDEAQHGRRGLHTAAAGSSSSSALQSAFPLPLRATTSLCTPTDAHQAALSSLTTTRPTVVAGEDVLLSTVSVCHSTGYYQPRPTTSSSPSTAVSRVTRHREDDKEDDDANGLDASAPPAERALHRAGGRLAALVHAIAEYRLHTDQPSAPTPTLRAGGSGAHDGVGFDTVPSSLLGSTPRPLTVLWETMPSPAETEAEADAHPACSAVLDADDWGSAPTTTVSEKTPHARSPSPAAGPRPSCCAVVLRSGVVVLERIAHLAPGSPFPLCALSVSSARSGDLATARPHMPAQGLLDVNARAASSCSATALATYLQQAPVMRYDVAVQTVLTASTNPCLLLTVHSAFAKETVFGTATFSPFTHPALVRTRRHTAGVVDVWLPLYAPASAVTVPTRTASPASAPEESDGPASAQGVVRVGWIHCDVEYTFSASLAASDSRVSRRSAAAAVGEEEAQLEQCLWRRIDVLETLDVRPGLPYATPPPAAELIDLTLVAATSLCTAVTGAEFAQTGTRSCSAFCEVEVLRKTPKATSRSARRAPEPDVTELQSSGQLSVDTASTASTHATASTTATARMTKTSTGAMPYTAPKASPHRGPRGRVADFPVTATVARSCEPVWQHTFRLRIDAGAGVRAVVIRVFDCAVATTNDATRLVGTVTLDVPLLRALAEATAAAATAVPQTASLSTTMRSTGPTWLPILPASRLAAGGTAAVVGAVLLSVARLSAWAGTGGSGQRRATPLLRWPLASETRRVRHRRPRAPTDASPRLMDARAQAEDENGNNDEETMASSAPLFLPAPLPSHTRWSFTYRHVCLLWPWLALVLRLHGGEAHLLVEPLDQDDKNDGISGAGAPCLTRDDLFTTPQTAPLTARVFALTAVQSDEDRWRLQYATQPAQWRRLMRRPRATATAATTDEVACTSLFTIHPVTDALDATTTSTSTASSSPPPCVFSGPATSGLRYRVLHGQPGRPLGESVVLGEGQWCRSSEAALSLTAATPLPTADARHEDCVRHARADPSREDGEAPARLCPAPAKVDVLVVPLTAQWTAPLRPTSASSGTTDAGGEQLLMPWTPASAHDGRAMVYPQHVEPGLLTFDVEAFPQLTTQRAPMEVTEPAEKKGEAQRAEDATTCEAVLQRQSSSSAPPSSAWAWPAVGQIAFVDLRIEDWIELPPEAACRPDHGHEVPMSPTAGWHTLGLSAREVGTEVDAEPIAAPCAWAQPLDRCPPSKDKDGRGPEVLHLQWPARRFPWFSRLPPVLALTWQTRTTASAAIEVVGETRLDFLNAFAAPSGRVWLPFYAPSSTTHRAVHRGFVRLRYHHNFALHSDAVPPRTLAPASVTRHQAARVLPVTPRTEPAEVVLVVRVVAVRQRPSRQHKDRTSAPPASAVVGYKAYSSALICPLVNEEEGEEEREQGCCLGTAPSEPVVFPFTPRTQGLSTATPQGALTGEHEDARQIRVQVMFTDATSGARCVGYALMAMSDADTDDVWLPLLSENTEEEEDAEEDEEHVVVGSQPRAVRRHRWLGEVRLCWAILTGGVDPSGGSYTSLPLPHLAFMTACVREKGRRHETGTPLAEADLLDVRPPSLPLSSTPRIACEYVILASLQWSPSTRCTSTSLAESATPLRQFALRVHGAGAGAAAEQAHRDCLLEPTVDTTRLRRAAGGASTGPIFTAATTTTAEAWPDTRVGVIAPVDALVVPFPHTDGDVTVPLEVEVLEVATPAVNSDSPPVWRCVARGVVVHQVQQSRPTLPERYSLHLYAPSPSQAAHGPNSTLRTTPPMVAGQLSLTLTTTASLTWQRTPKRQEVGGHDDNCEQTEDTAPRPLPRPAMALFEVALSSLNWHSAGRRLLNQPRDAPRPSVQAVCLTSVAAADITTDSPSTGQLMAHLQPTTTHTTTTSEGVEWAGCVCMRPTHREETDGLRADVQLAAVADKQAGGAYTWLSLRTPWSTGACAGAEEVPFYDAMTNICAGSLTWTWRLLATTDTLYNPRAVFFTRRADLRVTRGSGLVHGDVETLRLAAHRYQQLRHLAETRHNEGKRLNEAHRVRLESARRVLSELVMRASLEAVRCAQVDGATEADAIAAAMAERGFALDLFALNPHVRLTAVHADAFRAPTALHVLSHCPSLSCPVAEADLPPVVALPALPNTADSTTADAHALLIAAFECPFSPEEEEGEHEREAERVDRSTSLLSYTATPARAAATNTLTVQLRSCELPTRRRHSSSFVEGGGALGRGEWVLEAPPCTDPRPTTEHQLVRLHLFASPQQSLTLLTSATWRTMVRRGDSQLRCLRVRVPAHVLHVRPSAPLTPSREVGASSSRSPPPLLPRVALRLRLTYDFHVASGETYAVDVPLTMHALTNTTDHHADALTCDWTASSGASLVPRIGTFGGRLRVVELFADTPAGPRRGRASSTALQHVDEGVSLGRHVWTPADEAALFTLPSASASEAPQPAVHWLRCSPAAESPRLAASGTLACDLLLSREPLTSTPARPTISARAVHVDAAVLTMIGDVGATSACACRWSLVSHTNATETPTSADAPSPSWACVLAGAPAFALSRTVATAASPEDTATEPEDTRPTDATVDENEEAHADEEASTDTDADAEETTDDDDDAEEETSDSASEADAASAASSDFSAFDADRSRDKEDDEDDERSAAARKDNTRAMKRKEQKSDTKANKAKPKTGQKTKKAGTAAKKPTSAVSALQDILARAAGAAPTAARPVCAASPTVTSSTTLPGAICASEVHWRPLTPSDAGDDNDRLSPTRHAPLCVVPLSPSRPAAQALMALVSAAETSASTAVLYVACASVESMVDGLAEAPCTGNGGGVSTWPVFRVTDPVHLTWLRTHFLATQQDANKDSSTDEAGWVALWGHLQARRAASGDAAQAPVGHLAVSWHLRTTENGEEEPTATTAALPGAVAEGPSPALLPVGGEDNRTEAAQRALIHRVFHPTKPGLEEEMALTTTDLHSPRAVSRCELPEPRRGPFFALQRELTDMALARREEEEEALEAWLDRLSALHAARHVTPVPHAQTWDWVVRAVHVDALQLAHFEAAHDRLGPATESPSTSTTTTTRIGDLVVRVVHRLPARARTVKGQGSETHVMHAARLTAPPTLLCELSLLDSHGGEKRGHLFPPRRDGQDATRADEAEEPEWVIGVARAPALPMSTTSADPDADADAMTGATMRCQARFHTLSWPLTPAQLSVGAVRDSATLTLWHLVDGTVAEEADTSSNPPTAACLGGVSLAPLLAQLTAYTHSTTTSNTASTSVSGLSAVSAWLPLQPLSKDDIPGAPTTARVRVRLERVPHSGEPCLTPIEEVAEPTRVLPLPTPTRSLVTLCAQLQGLSVTPLAGPGGRTRAVATSGKSVAELPPVALLVTHTMPPSDEDDATDEASAMHPSGLVFSTHLLALTDATTPTTAAAVRGLHTARPPPLTTPTPAPPTVMAIPTALPVPVPMALPVPVPTAVTVVTSPDQHTPSSNSGSEEGEQTATVALSQRTNTRQASTVAGRSDAGRSERTLPVSRTVDLDSTNHTDDDDNDDDNEGHSDTKDNRLEPVNPARPESPFENFEDEDEDEDVTPSSAGAKTLSLVPVHALFCWQQTIPLTNPLNPRTDATTADALPLALRFHIARVNTTENAKRADLDANAHTTAAPSSRLGEVTESQVAELLSESTVPSVDWTWLLTTVAARLSDGELEPVTLHTAVDLVLPRHGVRVTLRLFVFAAPTASLSRAMEWLAATETARASPAQDARHASLTVPTTPTRWPRLIVSEEALATDATPVGPGSAVCTVLVTTPTPPPSSPVARPAEAKALSVLVGGLMPSHCADTTMPRPPQPAGKKRAWALDTSRRSDTTATSTMGVRQLAWARAWSWLAAEWDVELPTTSECGEDDKDAADASRRREAAHRAENRRGPLTAVAQRGVLRTLLRHSLACRGPSQNRLTRHAWHFTAVNTTTSPSTARARARADFGQLVGGRTGHVVVAYERLVQVEADATATTTTTGSPSTTTRRESVVLVDGGLAHCLVPLATRMDEDDTTAPTTAALISTPTSRRVSEASRQSGTALSGSRRASSKRTAPTPTRTSATADGARLSVPGRASQSSGLAPPAMSADVLEEMSRLAPGRVQASQLQPCVSVRWRIAACDWTAVEDCLVPDRTRASPTTSTAAVSPLIRLPQPARTATEAAPLTRARYVHHTGVVVGETLWLMGGWRVLVADAASTAAWPGPLPSRLLSTVAAAAPTGDVPSGLVARRRSEVHRAALLAAPTASTGKRVSDSKSDVDVDDHEDGEDAETARTAAFLFDDRDDVPTAHSAAAVTPTSSRSFGLHRDIRTLDLASHAAGAVPVRLRSLSHKPLVYSPAAASSSSHHTRTSAAGACPAHLAPLEDTPQVACHVAMTCGEWIVLFGGLTPTEAVWEDEEPPLAATDTVVVFHTRRLLWYRHRRDWRRRSTTNSVGVVPPPPPPSTSARPRGSEVEDGLPSRVQLWPLARYGHAVAPVPPSTSSTTDTTTYVVYGGVTTTISTGHQWLVPAEELLWLCHIHACEARVRWQRVSLPTHGPLTPRFLPSLQLMPVPAFLAVYAETQRGPHHRAPTRLPEGDEATSATTVITVTHGARGLTSSGAPGNVVSVADLCGDGGAEPAASSHFVLVVSGGSAQRTTPFSATAVPAASPVLNFDVSAPSLSTRSLSPQRTPATTPMKAPSIAVEDRSPCGMYSAFVENWLGGSPLGTVFAHVRLCE